MTRKTLIDISDEATGVAMFAGDEEIMERYRQYWDEGWVILYWSGDEDAPGDFSAHIEDNCFSGERNSYFHTAVIPNASFNPGLDGVAFFSFFLNDEVVRDWMKADPYLKDVGTLLQAAAQLGKPAVIHNIRYLPGTKNTQVEILTSQSVWSLYKDLGGPAWSDTSSV